MELKSMLLKTLL